FAISRRRIAPVGVGPHRYALPDCRARTPTAPSHASGRFALRAQQTVDSCGTDVEQPTSHHPVELEMAVTFHCLYQHRAKNSKPLPEAAIGRLPQPRGRLMPRFVV